MSTNRRAAGAQNGAPRAPALSHREMLEAEGKGIISLAHDFARASAPDGALAARISALNRDFHAKIWILEPMTECSYKSLAEATNLAIRNAAAVHNVPVHYSETEAAGLTQTAHATSILDLIYGTGDDTYGLNLFKATARRDEPRKPMPPITVRAEDGL